MGEAYRRAENADKDYLNVTTTDLWTTFNTAPRLDRIGVGES